MFEKVFRRAQSFFSDVCNTVLKTDDHSNGNADTVTSATQTRAPTFSTSSDVFSSFDFTADGSGATLDAQNNAKVSTRSASTASAASSALTFSSVSSTSGFVSSASVCSRQELSDFSPVEKQTTSPPFSNENAASLQKSSSSEAEERMEASESFKVPAAPPSDASRSWLVPNVSLSPVVEGQQHSVASLSSGRNNSFDDFDAPPALVANVLVVSHGGLITQMFRRFKRLGCAIDDRFIKPPPNASISKFLVTLNGGESGAREPQVTSVALHEVEHLECLMGQ